ncbi:hypothetical protein, partial [Pseudomonas sp. URMO17WK12:I11]|uniref:hypothetical protein n=1 Tax=Pseudomonas sp. URMO17WK12:I11 TaxID=1283291 RepID=UPI001C498A74
SSRPPATPSGVLRTLGPPDAYARPPEVAICVVWTIARLEARAKAKSKSKSKSKSKREREQWYLHV